MSSSPPIHILELKTDDEIASAFPIIHELREHLIEADFLATMRRQKRGGYHLLGGKTDRLVVVAGVRKATTLARGPHLFVDDLVTASGERGKGYGMAMLRWLAQYALGLKLPRIYLDSRETAEGFYKQKGFTFLTARPCWIETQSLLRLSPSPSKSDVST